MLRKIKRKVIIAGTIIVLSQLDYIQNRQLGFEMEADGVTSAIYFSMNQWLNGLAYRMTIQWWIFVVAGGMALFVALLTVCTLALRAASANPMDSYSLGFISFNPTYKANF